MCEFITIYLITPWQLGYLRRQLSWPIATYYAGIFSVGLRKTMRNSRQLSWPIATYYAGIFSVGLRKTMRNSRQLSWPIATYYAGIFSVIQRKAMRNSNLHSNRKSTQQQPEASNIIKTRGEQTKASSTSSRKNHGQRLAKIFIPILQYSPLVPFISL